MRYRVVKVRSALTPRWWQFRLRRKWNKLVRDTVDGRKLTSPEVQKAIREIEERHYLRGK